MYLSTFSYHPALIVPSDNSYFQSSIDFNLLLSQPACVIDIPLSESMHTFLKGEITLDMSDFKSNLQSKE